MVHGPGRSGKPTASFDGTILTGNVFSGASNTIAEGANFLSSDFHHVGTADNWSVTRSLASVTKFYNQYVVEMCRITWIPQVGPASTLASSKIHLAYVDNAERMNNFHTRAGATPQFDRLAMTVGCRNVFSFNAWERVTWNVPLTRRRKWFDTNTTSAGTTVDEFERCVQGMIFCAYESTVAGVSLGTFKIDFRVRLNGLDAASVSVT